MHRCAVALALSAGAAAASAQIAFTDMSSSAGVGQATESYGASWGDLNGDGYLDLYANNHRLQDSLFLNRGDGTFVDTASQVRTWVNHKHGDTHGGSWSDFDNDGDLDLLVSTGTGNPAQFFVNDHGELLDRTVALGADAPSVGGRMPVWLDFNGDRLPDYVMTQFGGIAKLFWQQPDGAGFVDVTSAARLNCKAFHYGQLYDVNDDGRLDFLCPDQEKFPQKIYDTLPFPWVRLFDSQAPNSTFPLINQVADSIIADFNNDGRMDLFLLSGVQLRPSSVVQSGSNRVEAQLAGGTKGFKFVSAGAVTFLMDWNKADEGTTTDLSKIQIGAGKRHPTAIPFTLDPSDPTVAGVPTAPTVEGELPVTQIGYDPATRRWTFRIQTKLATGTGPTIFSEAYVQVTTAAALSGLQSTGLWVGDKPGRPTLLMNFSGGYSDETVVAGLSSPIQCASATAGDFDNDMDVDLFLACGSGASNTADILYQNQGNGTFTTVANAGGAAGPVGIAVGSGAGTADSAVAGDYDVDGFLDLFVTNGMGLRPLYFGGPNRLFHNRGNSNRWIELDLVGTGSDRAATGARIYATANGVTQKRIQNGAYHRWSQDSMRTHFGLAGASTVTLRVEWPSGTVQTLPNVATNKLYRLTESAAISPVALGVAPAYPCGAPTFNAASESGVFIWKDCPSGEWRLKSAAGGGNVNYRGTITSTATYTKVKPVALSAGDTIDYTTDPKQIAFSFVTKGSSSDGVNFVPQSGTGACLKIDAPSGTSQVFFGRFRKPLTEPIELTTQTSC